MIKNYVRKVVFQALTELAEKIEGLAGEVADIEEEFKDEVSTLHEKVDSLETDKVDQDKMAETVDDLYERIAGLESRIEALEKAERVRSNS